jgi:surface protein
MATSDKLQKLLETKEQIRQAIIDKGVEVGDDVVFADYSNKIAAIEAGGSGPDYISLRTNNHTDYRYLFSYYNGDSLDVFELDTWDTSNVTTMKNTFSNCEVKDYNLSNWDFSKVTETSNMFSHSDAVNIDLSNWTVNPELRYYSMGQMFMGCYNLETIDIRNLNITDCNSKPTTGNAFFDCNKLHTLRLDNCPNDTINKIITSTGFPTGTIDGVQRKIYVNPDDIGDLTAPTNWIFVDSDGNEIVQQEIPLYQPDMFSGNTDIEEVSVMVTSEHTDLNCMFSDCENLRIINNISEWDTSNVTDMSFMFNGCTSLESLDLSSFNTSNVESISDMFSNCENLKELNLSNFEVKEDCDTGWILNNCRSLHTLRLDNCNEDTIKNIIESLSFPTNAITGVTRKIYCKKAIAAVLAEPTNWEFEYVD